jgi:carboxypeptidase family protein
VKSLVAVLGVALMAAVLAAPAAAQRNKDQSPSRSLQGQVMGKDDAPLEKAVVYLKNTNSLQVRTYITSPDGQYQFNALSPNVDYEIYADFQGQRSDTKTLSSFDSRPKATINLHVSVK